MHHRLERLLLVAPPAATHWSGPLPEWRHPVIQRPGGGSVEINLPLFWYDPPWHRIPTDRANPLATAVGQTGVLVSALRSELATPNADSPFHSGFASESEQAGIAAPADRMVPYRPERYGLAQRDFDGARIIDVRLHTQRDESGRFAYSAEQIERWEATPSGQPVSGGSWVPATTFPPDVASFAQLGIKLDQLRMLSPTAAVFVSLGPWRLEEELRAVVASQPDGLILRLDEIAAEGIELAELTRHARTLIDRFGASQLPLWVVPGAVSADDAAKLVLLGASAVAIDAWCENLFESAVGKDRSVAARLGYASTHSSYFSHVSQLVAKDVQPLLDRFQGLLNSIQTLRPEHRLGSLSQEWCERLGLQLRIIPSLRSAGQ